MRILADETVGLIIDMQERLYPHIADHDELTRRTGILIEGLKAIDVKILVTEQYTKGLGATIAPLEKCYRKLSLSKNRLLAAATSRLFSSSFRR